MTPPQPSAFRELPYMGVIYVVVEALKLGYSADDPQWANLGQGQPEVGPIDGAPPRLDQIAVLPADYAYGPVEGLKELRDQVAEHYNRLYRRGKRTQYTAANVAIAAGGRTTLTRTFAALDSVRLGYFTPDYTAYEDLLTAFQRVTPFQIELQAKEAFSITPQKLEEIVRKNELRGLLISNPCNPTGRVIAGDELNAWVSMSRATNCTAIFDEYYSHYIWAYNQAAAGPVSSAEFVEDVEKDPILIIDGLTKNYRYPGWRLGWALGPQHMIRNITAAGSSIDGGPPRPMQRAAIEVLQQQRADQETSAVRSVFRKKMDVTIEKLREVGIEFPLEPQGTFYAFGSIAKLPAPFNNGMTFFREALKHKVLTVPGEFFDVNPNKQRKGPSPLQSFVRFSYGPPMTTLVPGLERLQKMLS